MQISLISELRRFCILTSWLNIEISGERFYGNFIIKMCKIVKVYIFCKYFSRFFLTIPWVFDIFIPKFARLDKNSLKSSPEANAESSPKSSPEFILSFISRWPKNYRLAVRLKAHICRRFLENICFQNKLLLIDNIPQPETFERQMNVLQMEAMWVSAKKRRNGTKDKIHCD